MPRETPDQFRARATAVYANVRVALLILIICTGVVGAVAGVAIGVLIRAHDDNPELPKAVALMLAGLIGLLAGGVVGAAIAAVVYIPVTLIYAMSQDGA